MQPTAQAVGKRKRNHQAPKGATEEISAERRFTKDAVELFLQEIALEYRNQPKVQAQAKTDAEDFLRRVRAGLI